MLETIIERGGDPRFVAAILCGIAATATVFTLVQPMLETDQLSKRMKFVSDEREQLRRRERERLDSKVSLRSEPKVYMKQVVEQLNLAKWLGEDASKAKLVTAGYRASSAETAFLFFRLVTPLVTTLVAAFYLFVIEILDQPFVMRLGVLILAALIGMKLPGLYLRNRTTKRQAEIRKAWPDALDLVLICVESGMSIENAFRKVGAEIATNSMTLAEEFAVATAELSYLPDRRSAYENLAARIDLDCVKAITAALIQAERFGTPLGQALRVLAQESRDERMNAAEKKAAALPPKLTVPMILFFLPVLFVVILTPAAIQTMGLR